MTKTAPCQPSEWLVAALAREQPEYGFSGHLLLSRWRAGFRPTNRHAHAVLIRAAAVELETEGGPKKLVAALRAHARRCYVFGARRQRPVL